MRRLLLQQVLVQMDTSDSGRADGTNHLKGRFSDKAQLIPEPFKWMEV